METILLDDMPTDLLSPALQIGVSQRSLALWSRALICLLGPYEPRSEVEIFGKSSAAIEAECLVQYVGQIGTGVAQCAQSARVR